MAVGIPSFAKVLVKRRISKFLIVLFVISKDDPTQIKIDIIPTNYWNYF